jgi:hypothetical protein
MKHRCSKPLVHVDHLVYLDHLIFVAEEVYGTSGVIWRSLHVVKVQWHCTVYYHTRGRRIKSIWPCCTQDDDRRVA